MKKIIKLIFITIVLVSILSINTYPFEPTNISGCVLWVDSDTNGISSGTSIANWSDKSGKGNNLIYNNSQGIWDTNRTPNGQPSVSFNGDTAGYYAFQTSSLFFSNYMSMFIV